MDRPGIFVLLLVLCAPASRAMGQVGADDIPVLRHFSGWEAGTPTTDQIRRFRYGAAEIDEHGHSAEWVLSRARPSDDELVAFESKLDTRTLFRSNFRRTIELIEKAYQPFVYGGKPDAQYPETVALISSIGLECSGTIVARDAVLTAAHCLCGNALKYAVTGSSAAGLNARRHALQAGGNRPPQVGCPVDHALGDLAIVRLMPGTQFSAAVVPAQLATTAPIDASTALRLVGYGQTESRVTGQRRAADVVVAASRCDDSAAATNTTFGCSGAHELVAGGGGLRVDSCHGDSGGPAYVITSQKDPRPHLIAAVTSRAANGVRGCGQGGIYTRVDAALGTWIEGQIRVVQP